MEIDRCIVAVWICCTGMLFHAVCLCDVADWL